MKKKYKLVKGLITTSLISGIVIQSIIPAKASSLQNQYLSTEPTNIEEFKDELENIQNAESITFQNKELYDLVKASIKRELNTNSLRNIKTLTIDKPLTNNDLSDLKYLTGLRFLTIKDNKINCEDLKYNQELIGLKIEDSTVTNTEALPNSLNNIYLINTNVKEYSLTLPYNLEELTLENTPINNLNAKNTSSLKRLTINGEVYLSATCLVPLSNLNTIIIKYCSSLKDSESLCKIPKLKFLSIDDYSSIWLDKETLDKLPVFPLIKYNIKDKINELDQIAENLRDDSLSDIEQITKITEYLINKYYYDKDVSNDSFIGDIRTTLNNNFPITMSLDNNNVICINYATLFQAIANRLDIDSVLLLNSNHAWNAYNINGEYLRLDITSLDSYASLKNNDITPSWIELNSFKVTDYRPIYDGVVYPIEKEDINTTIGYIKQEDNPDKLIEILRKELNNLIYSTETFNIYAKPTNILLPTLLILESIYIYKYIILSKKKEIKSKYSKKKLKKIK